VNWLDEGALYSSIGLFLREDLGRGDITTQTVLSRNVRAKGRFVAGEQMVVAGLEAAEEVFVTLDAQQQIEAFTADGEEVEAGKVIARMVGFADAVGGRHLDESRRAIGAPHPRSTWSGGSTQSHHRGLRQDWNADTR